MATPRSVRASDGSGSGPTLVDPPIVPRPDGPALDERSCGRLARMGGVRSVSDTAAKTTAEHRTDQEIGKRIDRSGARRSELAWTRCDRCRNAHDCVAAVDWCTLT